MSLTALATVNTVVSEASNIASFEIALLLLLSEAVFDLYEELFKAV